MKDKTVTNYAYSPLIRHGNWTSSIIGFFVGNMISKNGDMYSTAMLDYQRVSSWLSACQHQHHLHFLPIFCFISSRFTGESRTVHPSGSCAVFLVLPCKYRCHTVRKTGPPDLHDGRTGYWGLFLSQKKRCDFCNHQFPYNIAINWNPPFSGKKKTSTNTLSIYIYR